MNIKKYYLIVKNFPFIYVIALFALFLVIILTTLRTHNRVDSHYEVAHLTKEESKLSQLTSTELNEIRLLLISRIIDFSKILKKFKLLKSNSTIDVTNVPAGLLSISKTINKWSNLTSNDSLQISLNDLNVNYLNRIVLEDATVDKQSGTVNIVMKLKQIQFGGRFELCVKNNGSNCLNGDFEQITNESVVSWSAKLILHDDHLKFSLNEVNLKNRFDTAKLLTRIHLESEQVSNQFVDKVITEFIKPHLSKEFNKLINLEIGQTISTIYADLFELKKSDNLSANSSKKDFMKEVDEESIDKSFVKGQQTNQTTIQLLRNLVNLPSMISNVMFKFLEQNLKTKNSPKITFHNQDIEAILNTNQSTLQNLKSRYFATLKDHFENVELDLKTKQNLPTIAQPFLELIESQLRETIETKIDGLINSMMVNLNNHIVKQKTALSDHQDESKSGDLEAVDETIAEFDHHEVGNVDNEELIPENDEIIDEYTQTVRSQRRKRQVPCQRGPDLDEYVDSLFRFASRLVRAMEPIGLPNATIDLPEYNMKLFLHHGGATRAYTLQRKRPAWVYCTNESVSLGLTVGFEDIRVKYKYRAIKDWGLLWDGELEAKMEHAKLQVQFTQTTPEEDSEVPVMQRIDRIRIWRLGHVRVMIKGLGNFTQAVSMLLTRMLNQNIDQLGPTLRHLEGEVIQIGNQMLKNISIPFFSII